MSDIEIAKEMLLEKNYSCVIISDYKVLYTSYARGVKPLMDFYSSDLYKEKENIVLADKIIGKATVMLCKLCSIKEIYTPIASKSAIEACKEYNITIKFDKSVNRIQNRTKDGYCPMETLALETNDPIDLHKKILDFYADAKT